MNWRREYRYRLWLWFGIIRTNEKSMFKFRQRYGVWPWEL